MLTKGNAPKTIRHIHGLISAAMTEDGAVFLTHAECRLIME